VIRQIRYSGKVFYALLLCVSTLAWGATPPTALDAGMVNPGYEAKPSWFKQSFLDLREDLAEAAAENKQLMLYFYQDGCPYCAKLLRDNFSQRAIEQKTRANYDVIAVNMWGDREVVDLAGEQMTEKFFASKMRVMFTPTIILLDNKGRQRLRINGYYPPAKYLAALDYAATPTSRGQSFAEFYHQRAPRKASGKLHSQPFFIKPPYDLKRLSQANKPLLILFEQKVCQACDEQHEDIFKRKATLQQLSRYNIVRLDMWADTRITGLDGKPGTARQLARKLDVKYAPSMVFVDATGREVFRSEAYLKAFHIQSVLDYVASGAYKTQASFQRFIAARADRLEAQGIHIELMK